ncbi:ABC transporter permease [Acuticoccus kandeliae]|uniref:ABC transporter permease n=1 Tax=Acuticoccus kandeliae TaxID=2073160 RepID=UPI000D3ED5A8|nr:ABC transporter permease [Acuticoccus kandeliae]
MIRFLFSRALELVGLLFGLLVLTFLIANVAPGDPAGLVAGPNATPEMVETIRKEYGLDRPLYEQLVAYVGDVLQGDLGRSLSTTRDVVDELAEALPKSLELVLAALVIAVFGGVTLGVLSAVFRDSWIDHGMRIFAVSGVALPLFWFGILLQLYFAVRLGWLPVSGRIGFLADMPQPVTHILLIDCIIGGKWETAREALGYLILPAIVLAFPSLAAITRITRAEMIEVLGSDFVLGGRAHGLAPWRIVCRHALRNAMLPILSLTALRYGWMLEGSILVETVFDWPGLGTMAVNAALLSDFKPVIGVTLVIGANFMIVNFLVDVAYAWLDPRLRQKGAR